MSTILIKFGGEVANTLDQFNNLIHSIEVLHQQKDKIVIVHGGGPQATDLSTKLNLTPRFVGGRRITDAETLEVMKMTLAGVINSDILAKFRSRALPGAAVSGITVVMAKKRPPKAVSGSNGEVIDFGLVGDILEIDTGVIELLINNNFIPVISPLSCDSQGLILNINADTVAVAIARKLRVDKFIFITSVGGVFQDISNKNSRFTTLSVSQAKEKIKNGVIQGGMIPKLEESFSLLEDGLGSFHIVGVDSPDGLSREINRPGTVGTALIK
ncbi:MAG: acetylglutamate kinase [Pseudomonadota bacterium]